MGGAGAGGGGGGASQRVVHVAAAATQQRIGRDTSAADDNDEERASSSYTRLVTPTQALARPTLRQQLQERGHIHHTLVIGDSDDDDDEDDDEDDGGNPRRARVGSAASTAMLHSVTQAPLARLNPRLGLSKFSNRFADERLETSYQLFSSTGDFPVARRLVLALLAFELGGLALSLMLRPNCDPTQLAADCFTYGLDANSVGAGYTALNWLFAPLALLYGLLPLKYFERNAGLRYGVYFVRRRWKELAALIVLAWSVGSAVTLAHTLTKMRTLFQNSVFKQSSCGRNITVPPAWYQESNWHNVNKGLFEDHGMYVREWIFIYGSKVAYSVIVAVLAALGAFVGIMTVSMKLDFVHVFVVSVVQSATTLIVVVTGPSMSLNSGIGHKITNQTVLFVLCVIMPAWVTLVATYSEDRAARSAYVSKLHAERMNTAMKLDLSVKRNGLENQQVGADEKEAMAAALGNEDDMAVCRSVAIRFADLQLKDIITKGPTGDVLLAHYHGTSVVLKRLAVSSLTSEGLKDFKVRVELLACLRHPNIVQFIGATFDNLANVGLVLEYLERGDVMTLLRSEMPLTWSDPLLKIATAVAQGMTYLHNCDPPLVHRDLKSSNLLCTPTYSCKISDFGESKRQRGAAAVFSTVVGTPYWVAPEIIREERYDMQVDCYSFGIVLIELETRKVPYYDLRDYEAVDIMQLVAFGNLRPTIPASCSPYRRQLITRCLDGDPRRRPKMAEILSVLQNEVRQELLDQNSIDSHRDKRRMLLMQRHQRLNRRGLKALMREEQENDSE